MSGAWRMIVRNPGGPEALERETFDPGRPGTGEVRLAHRAVGVNYIDTYYRSGLYPLPLPASLGSEAAGVIEEVGDGVTDFAPGDRVAIYMPQPRAYATHSIVPASALIPLPEAISDEVAAAVLLKGLTAWMLAERIAKAGPGQTVLVHAAAGGVGSLLVPWLKSLGATVIAHAGSPEKAARAAALGADHALSGSFDTLASEVRALTGGRGVDSVLDGVGAASWTASLDSIAPRGLMVSYGNASGPVPPFPPLALAQRGSLFLTRPSLGSYTATREEREGGARALFDRIRSGALPVEIGQRYALADAAEAHRALEARETTGSTILIP
jgi:NADPH2:quinone reductase